MKLEARAFPHNGGGGNHTVSVWSDGLSVATLFVHARDHEDEGAAVAQALAKLIDGATLRLEK